MDNVVEAVAVQRKANVSRSRVAVLAMCLALACSPVFAQTSPTAFTVDWEDLTGAVFTQGSLAITAGLVLGGAILAFKFSWKMIKRMAS